MNTNALVVALCTLSLGATGYVIVSMPRGADPRVAELERRLEAAEQRADTTESLRAEISELVRALNTSHLQLDATRVLDRVQASSDLGVRVAAASGADAKPADAADPAKPLEDRIAE